MYIQLLVQCTGRQQCRRIIPKVCVYVCMYIYIWNFSSILTVAPVGSSVGALYQKLYIQSKSSPEDGLICRPKHVGLI